MPRLRLVAGPNGSGKTTLTKELIRKNIPLGQYLNPDDIARHISINAIIDGMYNERGFVGSDRKPKEFSSNFENIFAAILAQNVSLGLREDWVELGLSMTCESVMSDKRHLDFVDRAIKSGYEVYLYYICISDPERNIERVRQRVDNGGHDVPQEKIVERHRKSLLHLFDMAVKCKRVYLFDNSHENSIHFAEITPDGYLDISEKDFYKFDHEWFVEALLKKWDRAKIRIASW
ncbi:zeta toxin family protein [Chrysiogenes arsenatis]|uniref:zeta toxin family protein n=1 Tax=Chrysiogenes arsenatis TaxID=309797 RepID=UPI0003F56DDA|nr:AAA family ATPase [Chrysiogenes arsenatis]